MKGPGPRERPETRARWPQDGLNVGQVELRLPKISTSWLKMAKMSDKMRQDGGKKRQMRDVPSLFTPSGGGPSVAGEQVSEPRPRGGPPLRAGKPFPRFGLES